MMKRCFVYFSISCRSVCGWLCDCVYTYSAEPRFQVSVCLLFIYVSALLRIIEHEAILKTTLQSSWWRLATLKVLVFLMKWPLSANGEATSLCITDWDKMNGWIITPPDVSYPCDAKTSPSPSPEQLSSCPSSSWLTSPLRLALAPITETRGHVWGVAVKILYNLITNKSK